MSKKLTDAEKAANKANKEAEKKSAAEKKAAEKAAAKAARPKLVRKTPPFRKYAQSPAGHFADVIGALGRRLGEMKKKTARWGSGLTEAIDAVLPHTTNLQNALEALAGAGFKPKKGGAKRIPTFTPGNVVKLSDEALAYLRRDFSKLTPEHIVIVTDTYEEGDKSIPVCCYDATAENGYGQWLGRVTYKWVTVVADEIASAPADSTDASAA